MTAYSTFWSRVQPRHKQPAIASFEGCDLEYATMQAYQSKDMRFAARTNRELIDLHAAFRTFQLDGRQYIAKKVSFPSALQEQMNAAMLAEVLDGTWLENGLRLSVCPVHAFDLGHGQAAVVTQYHGHSLQQAPRDGSGALDRIGLDVSRAFLDKQVLWVGNAPRNLCKDDDQGLLHIFDAENASFNVSSDKLAADPIMQMTFVANWSPHLRPADYGSILKYPIQRKGALHSYENALLRLSGMTDPETVRRLAIATLVDASRCWDDDYTDVLYPCEIAHICKDFLNYEGRFAASCLIGKLRDQPQIRFAFDTLVTQILCDALSVAGYGTSLSGDWSHIRETVHTIIACLAVTADTVETQPEQVITELQATAAPFALAQEFDRSFAMRAPDALAPVLAKALNCKGDLSPLTAQLQSQLQQKPAVLQFKVG